MFRSKALTPLWATEVQLIFDEYTSLATSEQSSTTAEYIWKRLRCKNKEEQIGTGKRETNKKEEKYVYVG